MNSPPSSSQPPPADPAPPATAPEPAAATKDGGPWFRGGVHFECTQCGKCCEAIPPGEWQVDVTDADAARLAAFLGLPLDAFLDRYTVVTEDGDRVMKTADQPNHNCPFYDAVTKLCRVHPAKPNQCASFPYWPDALASREAWEAEKPQCEGVGRGPLITADEILAGLRRYGHPPPA